MNNTIKYIIFFLIGLIIYKLLNNVDTLIFKVDDSIKEDFTHTGSDDCVYCTMKKVFTNPKPLKVLEELNSMPGLNDRQIIDKYNEALDILNINDNSFFQKKLFYMKYIKTSSTGEVIATFQNIFNLLDINNAININYTFTREARVAGHSAILYKDTDGNYCYIGTNDRTYTYDNVEELVKKIERRGAIINIGILLFTLPQDTGELYPIIINNDPSNNFGFKMYGADVDTTILEPTYDELYNGGNILDTVSVQMQEPVPVLEPEPALEPVECEILDNEEECIRLGELSVADGGAHSHCKWDLSKTPPCYEFDIYD